MDPGIRRRDGYFCYDLATLPPKRLELGPGEVVISPDGRRYAAVNGRWGGREPRALTLYDLPSLREIARVEADWLVGAGFSPDGRRLLLLGRWNEALPPGTEPRHALEIRLLDPATARVVVTIPSPGQTWGNYGWTFSPDGTTLAVYYRTGSNVTRAGDPDPTDRPMNVELWEVPPP
jgi:hypothetical protein